jgi:hypothetical protein
MDAPVRQPGRSAPLRCRRRAFSLEFPENSENIRELAGTSMIFIEKLMFIFIALAENSLLI